MKKRLLSAFLAVMMVLTMVPAVFAADITDNGNVISTNDELITAIQNAKDGDTITLGEGNFIFNSSEKYAKELTFVGSDDKTVCEIGDLSKNVNGEANGSYIFDGSDTVTFKNMMLKSDANNYRGFIRINNTVVENCTLEGRTTYWGYKAATFTNCTFNAPQGDYAVTDYSSPEMTFDGCTFNVSGKTINAYVEQLSDAAHKIVMNNCKIFSTKANKAVANIKNANQAWDVEISNTTAEGLAEDKTTGSNLYQVEGVATTDKPVSVSIDGETVWKNGAKVETVAEVNGKKYGSLQEAINAIDNLSAEPADHTVTLLADTTEDITFPENYSLALNLNGKKLTNKTGHTITVPESADVVIHGPGTIDNVTHGKGALVNYGHAYLYDGVVLERSQEKGTYTPYENGGNSWYTILNDKGGQLLIVDATVRNAGGYSSAIRNGGTSGYDESTLTIKGGNFSGGINSVKNDENGILKIEGGTFVNTSQYVIMNWNEAELNGDASYAANDTAKAVLFTSSYGDDESVKGQLTINGGYYKTTSDEQALICDHYDANNKGTATISGGYFTTDPSAYCADGLTGVPSNRADEYVWTVGEKSETKAEVATGEPAVTTEVSYPENSEEKKLLDATKDALSAAEVEGSGIATAAAVVANNNTVTADADVVKKLADAVNDSTVTADDTTIVIQTYMDMSITGVDATEGKKSITVDIQPMYRTVATTADVKNGDEIVLTGDNSQNVNAVQIGEPQKLSVTSETTVTIQLPDGFVTDGTATVYVQHKGYEYEATVSKDGDSYIATFTNPHGFSPFTISTTSKTVAKIGETKYTSLQDAVNAAETNDTVYVIGSDTNYTATASKNVTVKNGTGKEITVTINGTAKTIADQATAEFTYTKPSSGGSSGGGSSSSSTTYKVSTSAVANGGVTASPSTAKKGDKITITLSPNKGYKLDKLTVTDGSGKAVSVTKSSDTVYTFTMPASQVTVGVSYVKADGTTEQPSDTKLFSDVSSSDWFNDAVKYVVDKGMMNGVGNNKFAPNDSTTRGMLMTVIARYAGQDTTGSNPWYQKGMEWAKANGVSDGTQPEVNITREQLVTMLYRYAKSAGKDVSIGEDTNILSYADATTVSEYAIPAMQWACGAGIVNGSNGKLLPKNNATRAEVAAILMRFCENVK